MLRRYLPLLALLGAGLAAQAQSSATRFGFEYRPIGKVVQGTDTLQNAWAGGLNAPQFSNIDLNGDGQQDLFAFDRESSRVYTFLNTANSTGTGRHWQYAPDYAYLFPADLFNWALLKDYDCDGRPDLFTLSAGYDLRVFRNVAGPGGRPNFQVATSSLTYYNGLNGNGQPQYANLQLGTDSMPAFEDVNGDGKMDIVAYDFGSGSIRMALYLNRGSSGCTLDFGLDTNYWGSITACSGYCAQYVFNNGPCQLVAKPLHTPGHNLLVLDLDGDGLQDVLDGHDGCPQLMQLLNKGKLSEATFTLAGASRFPSSANPLSLDTFVGAYLVDVNFDGRRDLVAAPNIFENYADRVSLRNTTVLYENTAASGTPNFVYRTNSFLQSGMIDVSEAAAPAFGDLNGDGLKDMLVGNKADLVNGLYRSNLTYYQNVGTAQRPIFKWITDDYLDLSTRANGQTNSFVGMKPVLVDLNRDGALDLAYSAFYQTSNRLYYILNTAAAGQPAVFNTATTNYFKSTGAQGSGRLPFSEGDAPCFTDVDGDGFVDMLIGTDETLEPGASLRYFRNRGTGPLDYAFVVANDDFGGIRDAGTTSGLPAGLSSVVADFDNDGQPDLVTMDKSGTLRFFTNYRAQSPVFLEQTDLIYNPFSGVGEVSRLGRGFRTRTQLAAADMDGDGRPELYVGTQAGGVQSFVGRTFMPTAARPAVANALALSVYPNPANTSTTVETAKPTRLTLLDLTGRTVRQDATLLYTHALNLNGLAPGIYLVRATGADGLTAVQRVQVQ